MHSSKPLISWTEAGLHCELGDFHIDPHRPVRTAVITHAHSDHARRGSQKYITSQSGTGVLRARLGRSITVQSLSFGERMKIGAVTLSLHPAGHILGSAQVRVEHEGEVWVATGDYKREADPSCEPFEVVPCDTLITEATFGTPKYVWDKSRDHGLEIHQWWQQNAAKGMNSIVYGYSLGKTQRILAMLKPHARQPILIHPAMLEITECYLREGIQLAPFRLLEKFDLDPGLFQSRKLQGELILAPPSWLKDNAANLEGLGSYRTAFASGWVLDGTHRTDQGQHGFLISDHADWSDLNRTIDECGAKRIFVQHRANGALVRHLKKRGLEAYPSESLVVQNFHKLPERNLSLFEGLLDVR